MRSNSRFSRALLAPALLFLFVFLVLPIGMLVGISFQNQDAFMQQVDGLTVQRYVALLTTPSYLRDIGVTVLVALVTTVAAVIVAYPAANLLASTRSKTLRTVLYIVLVSPLLTSVVVRTFAWVVLLSRNGLINQVLVALGLAENPPGMLYNMPAVIVAYVQVLLPFVVMPLTTSLNEVRDDVRRASMCLGAGRARTFFSVVLPLTIPGLVNGAVIVFALTAGSYITPLLIGGGLQPLLPLDIYQQAIQVSDLRMAAAMSVVLLVVIFVLILPAEYALKRWEARVHG